jgi:hypothetical protein
LAAPVSIGPETDETGVETVVVVAGADAHAVQASKTRKSFVMGAG